MFLVISKELKNYLRVVGKLYYILTPAPLINKYKYLVKLYHKSNITLIYGFFPVGVAVYELINID